MGWQRRWSKRLRALFRQEAVDRELDEELAFHLEQETRKHVAAGLSEAEARRRAALAFGSADRFREEVREARRLDWVRGLSLDFRLGGRMLTRYPGLTLVGGVALAFAIAIGAGAFELVQMLVRPELPFAGGDRIVALENRDVRANEEEARALRDYAAWREQLTTVGDLGAYRLVQRNLFIEGAGAEPVRGAEISAVAFRMTGTPALLGRVLVAADEEPGAERVAVLGHDVWQRRFASDPAVIGRVVRLDGVPTTVVGVMPEGFGFPFVQSLWTPFRLNPLHYGWRDGPRIGVFGRLAPGVTLAQAQAELDAVGRRASTELSATHEHLRPRILSLPAAYVRLDLRYAPALYASNLFFVAFLVLVCANVALLMFARAATRENEIVVRSALGATRRRILAQLVVEALVLGALAAVVGVAAAAFGLRVAFSLIEGSGGLIPFWMEPRLSLTSVLYAIGLTLLGAVIAGTLPALKMTRGLGTQLRQAALGSGVQFGRTWTAVIVAQVALTVFMVLITIYVTQLTARIGSKDLGFPADEYLTAGLALEAEDPDNAPAARPQERLGEAHLELKRRLLAEPAVRSVAFAERLPGTYHARSQIQLEDVTVPESARLDVGIQTAGVDPEFFATLGAPIVAGRGFVPADLQPEQRVLVVNQSFVRHVLADRNPLGRRVRFRDLDDSGDDPWGPWHEIVGVVRDVSLTNDPELPHAGGIYRPVAPGAGEALQLLVHVRGEPHDFSARLRALALAADPALRVQKPRTVEQVKRDELGFYVTWFRILVGASVVILALSLAGIYAITAFTVARRTREFGIRLALGASRTQLITAVLVRPLRPVALGVIFAMATLVLLDGGIKSLRGGALVLGFTLLMTAIIMLATIVPVRRALRIEPLSAMRTEG